MADELDPARVREAVRRKLGIAGLSKATIFEIFTAAGGLAVHIQEARTPGMAFDIVAYEECRANWIRLAPEVRAIMRVLLGLVERTGPVGPREEP